MSSLMASTTATAAIPVAGGGSSNSASSLINNGTIIPPMAAQFREIHKNTWLKRLTAEGKKICVGPKKSERSWVVFCVHDDTEALLEGYAEPRQAPSHNPEWIVSMQDTLHISHALIPNSHEFEFVVTLSNEVVRFHAMSWDIMQEWVETLRSKLREMKILSPRENLYTKLPEVRAPLLPTRDPTSPLPAPPPVPAALVPGVERVVPPSIQQHQQQQQQLHNSTENSDSESTTRSESSQQQTASNNLNSSSCTSTSTTAACSSNPSTVPVTTAQSISSSTANTSQAPPPLLTSMSNTLTQNLLNMLLDPISAYSEHLNDANSSSSSIEADDMSAVGSLPLNLKSSLEQFQFCNYSSDEEFIGPLLRKPSDPTQSSTSAAASSSSNSVRLDILTGHRVSADQIKNLEHIFQCDSRIPRPHTSRSLSAGAVDKTKLQLNNFNSQKKTEPDGKNNESAGGGGKTVAVTNSKKENNITELEVNSIFETPSSSSTLSSSSSTTSDKNTNITIIQVSTEGNHHQSQHCESNEAAPKLPHKSTMNNAGSTPNNSTAGDVFTFPETYKPTQAKTSMKQQQQLEYKSNVQIIPSTSINSNTPNSNSCSNSNSSSSSSNSTSTIHVLGSNSNMTTATTTKDTTSNSYTTPVRKPTSNTSTSINETEQKQHHKITTVHVAGSDNTYGTCFTPPSSSALSTLNSTSSTPLNTSTPKLPKKIILSANTSGITNIVVNNISNEIMPVIRNNLETENALNSNSKHYDKVFLSTTAAAATVIENSGEQPSTSAALVPVVVAPMSPKYNAQKQKTSQVKTKDATAASCKTTGTVEKSLESHHKSPMSNNVPSRGGRIPMGSPAMPRRRIVSPPTQRINGIVNMPAAQQAPRPPFLLKRGLTEAIISSRPSRRDFHLFNKLQPISKTKSSHPLPASNLKSQASNGNNNGDAPGTSTAKAGSGLPPSAHLAINRTAASDGVEQRRRSSSTDAQSQRQQQQANNATSRGTNNNERQLSSNGAGGVGGPPLRQPPQPFRTTENILGSPSSPGNPSISRDNPQAKQRMTLREQQVMQLRREIMHPGGVRLQLRRKDCVGSIAWVDAFGAVWVAGWKQKEHPVLYNALHIGDQLLSIAGVTISSAAEANKIIRNTNTLFIEVLVRRIPFGRGYAIRRERECQCLGLIRDGNTATIVDVVPNSLAARHGLPPKAQSCDGSTLTFWVLTEINGRPLNLFFKDNEIRDRLNSVGRDISILVQPSDLVTKLKKQLKSLRGYKDYLVQ